MIEVIYDIYSAKHPALAILSPEPLHALTHAKRGTYLKCSATQEFYKNCFNVQTPFDTEFKLQHGRLITSGTDVVLDTQLEYNNYFVQLYPSYIFRSNQPVLVELHPPFLEPGLPLLYINGCFDISRWLRPVHLAGILNQDFNITKNQFIYGVKFVTPNNESVSLKRVALNATELKLLNSCVAVSTYSQGHDLPELYKNFNHMKGSFE